MIEAAFAALDAVFENDLVFWGLPVVAFLVALIVDRDQTIGELRKRRPADD